MGAGDLRGVFDGSTSPGLDLSGRLVVFNLREVKDEARPILMACTAAWLHESWARNDGVRRIVVLDDAASSAALPQLDVYAAGPRRCSPTTGPRSS
jgi:hypothetical protein